MSKWVINSRARWSWPFGIKFPLCLEIPKAIPFTACRFRHVQNGLEWFWLDLFFNLTKLGSGNGDWFISMFFLKYATSLSSAINPIVHIYFLSTNLANVFKGKVLYIVIISYNVGVPIFIIHSYVYAYIYIYTFHILQLYFWMVGKIFPLQGYII